MQTGPEKDCFQKVISTLDCLKRNSNSSSLESVCTVPKCVGSVAGIGVDLSDVIQNLKRGQSSMPISEQTPVTRKIEETSKTYGSSQTVDYEAGTPRPYKTSTSRTQTPRTGAYRRSSSSNPLAGPKQPIKPVSNVKTDAARCVAIESHPKELQWAYVDAEKYGLKEGCNGRWRTGRFTIGPWGSSKNNSLVYAEVRKQGAFLLVKNCCDNPVYIGVDGNVGRKLLPREERMIPLSPAYKGKNDNRPRTVELFVMWWERKSWSTFQ
ncbi:hypothetical protein BH10ACI2_BH10ACI2_09010 [soil metagenome]